MTLDLTHIRSQALLWRQRAEASADPERRKICLSLARDYDAYLDAALTTAQVEAATADDVTSGKQIT